MILTGKKIIEEVALGNIYIENFNSEKVNPNSYNLTLNPKLKVYVPEKVGCVLDMKKFVETGVEDYVETTYIDSLDNNKVRELEIPEEGLILQPGVLYLGSTNEWTATSKYIPMIDGRSSFARLGMKVHITAGFGDVGFEGTFTLEIEVTEPLMIYPNQEICQIYYQVPEGDTSIKYHGKYMNSREAMPCKLYTESEA